MAFTQVPFLSFIWLLLIWTSVCMPEEPTIKDGRNSSASIEDNSPLSAVPTAHDVELTTTTKTGVQIIPEKVRYDDYDAKNTTKFSHTNLNSNLGNVKADIKLSNEANSLINTDKTVPVSYKLPDSQTKSKTLSSVRKRESDLGVSYSTSLATVNLVDVTSSPNVPAQSESQDTQPVSSNSTQKLSHDQPILVVNLVLLVPESDIFMFSRRRIITALDIAQETLNTSGITSNFRIRFLFGNSDCSEILGPIRAFQFFWKNQVDAFLGPACDYSVAPVARYAAYWQVPVLSPGALSFDFDTNKKSQYRSLTRMGASLGNVVHLLLRTMERYGWRKVVMVYDPVVHISNIPRLCFLAASAMSYISKQQGFEAKPEFSGDPEKVLRSKVGADYAGELKLC